MKYDRVALADILETGFNDQVVSSEKETRVFIREHLNNPEFTEAVRELILDSSETFIQKVERYVYSYAPTEERGIEVFRHIWEVVSNGQPWPLDK